MEGSFIKNIIFEKEYINRYYKKLCKQLLMLGIFEWITKVINLFIKYCLN